MPSIPEPAAISLKIPIDHRFASDGQLYERSIKEGPKIGAPP